MDDLRRGNKHTVLPQLVAHRGNSPGYKELTRAAFEYSLSLPIHGVECDVRMCRSGELVLHHDRRVGRTLAQRTPMLSGGMPKISDLTLEQLGTYNVGTVDLVQRIMTLDQLLGMIVDAGDKHLYLEIKHPTRYGRMAEEQVVRSLRYAGLLDDERIHIISFSHTSMRRMNQLAPGLDRIYLRRHWELRYNPRDVRFSNPTGLGLSMGTAKVRPELVGANDLPTYMWTANTPADVEMAQRLGADVVTTDNPEMALHTLSAAAYVD